MFPNHLLTLLNTKVSRDFVQLKLFSFLSLDRIFVTCFHLITIIIIIIIHNDVFCTLELNFQLTLSTSRKNVITYKLKM